MSEEQQSLFPVGESTEAVEKEATAALPITTQNTVVTLLRKYGNTVLNEERKNVQQNGS